MIIILTVVLNKIQRAKRDLKKTNFEQELISYDIYPLAFMGNRFFLLKGISLLARRALTAQPGVGGEQSSAEKKEVVGDRLLFPLSFILLLLHLCS